MLKKVREAKHMTQAQLAKKVGVTRQAIGLYESGVNKPSVEIAKAIGRELEFDWTKLYD